MFIIRDREAGNVIDTFITYEQALKTMQEYEEDDRRDGSYTDDFYEITTQEQAEAHRDEDGSMIWSRCWVVVDDATTTRAACFDHVIDAVTFQEALTAATQEFNRLTDSEKKGRDAFYFGLCEIDEDGLYTFDSMINTVDVKGLEAEQ